MLIALALLAAEPDEEPKKDTAKERLMVIERAEWDFNNCVFVFIEKYIAQREPADTLVSAAFGDCSSHAASLKGTWLVQGPDMSITAAEQVLVAHKAKLREYALAMIIRERGQKP